MELTLTDSERVLLWQAQSACRSKTGYVPVTVSLMLDRGRPAGAIAQDLGPDVNNVYRYIQTYHLRDLAGYLATE